VFQRCAREGSDELHDGDVYRECFAVTVTHTLEAGSEQRS
jgi:hypothetical protein